MIDYNKVYRYSIRKFKVGVGSAVVGITLAFSGPAVLANEVVNNEVSTPSVEQVSEIPVVTTDEMSKSSVSDVNAVVSVVEDVTAPVATVNEPTIATEEKIIEPSREVSETTQVSDPLDTPITDSELLNPSLEEAKVSEVLEKSDSEVAHSLVVEQAPSKTSFRNTGTNTQLQHDVYKAVEADLKAVELNTSTAIADQLVPARISAIDVVNKRLEISKVTGRNILQVTEEEATAAIKAESLGKLHLDEGFAAAKNDLENLVKRAVGDAVILNPQTTTQDYIAKIQANKEKLLLGAAYINKYYDLQFGATNAKDMLKTNPSFYGGQDKQSALDFLIAVGSQNYQEMSITNTVNTYNKLFLNKVSNKTTIPEFLEFNNKIFNTGKTIQDWFVGETKAYISEVKSQEANKQDSKYRIYDRLKDATHLHYNILPLLAVSDNSLYALSNTAGITFGIVDAYVNKTADLNTQATQLNEFKTNLEKANRTQQNFIDFWYRIAKPETHKFLEEPTMTVDTLLKRTDQVGGDPRNRWSAQSGDSAALGVKEFIAPMGLYANYIQVGGEAAGNTVRLYLTKALETNGLTTYAHELTHIYEDKVWMAQGVRDGLLAEFYARGLYEPYQYFEDPYFNINSMFEIDKATGLYNQSPRRFENADDLKEYMSGTFDVLYTLDLLEAETILAKSDADKKWWFNKIQMTDTKYKEAGYTHKANEVIKLDDVTAAKLKSVNDLVDNDIIAERTPLKGYNRIGKFENNDYYSVPMFSSNYAALENDTGVSGDYQTRRMAYELLAQYGYYEGMVPYISNQYKNDATTAGQVLSDKFILGKIFNGEFTDAKDFKKEMFKIRQDKLDKLKPVTITYKNATHTIDSVDKLKELFKDAVESDLATKPSVDRAFAYRVRNVELLKDAIYKAYSLQTGEFRDSIYREPLADTNEPTTAPVKATWTNGYVAPAEEIVKNAVTIDDKLVKSKELVPAESTQSEVTVLVTYTDGSTDKVKVPVSIDPVTKQETTARSTRFERNDNLDFGQRETVTGKDGSFENVFTYVLENGRFIEKVSKRNEVVAIDDLVKVGTKIKTETKVLPKGTNYQADETKDFGTEEVRVIGTDGQEVATTTYTMDSHGNVTADPVQVTRTEAIDTLIVKGTKSTTRVEENPYGVIKTDAEDLKVGTEIVKVKGQNEIVHHVTTYNLDTVTGNIIPTTTRLIIQAKVDEVVAVGVLETAKGVSLTAQELQQLVIDGMPVYEKGTSVTQGEKPSIPAVIARGDSLKQENLPEIELVFEKGGSLKEGDKPVLEMPLMTSKGTSLSQEVLPSLNLPKEETAKGESLVQDAKSFAKLSIITAKGGSLRQEVLKELEINTSGQANLILEKNKSFQGAELPSTYLIEVRDGNSQKNSLIDSVSQEESLPKTNDKASPTTFAGFALLTSLAFVDMNRRRKTKD